MSADAKDTRAQRQGELDQAQTMADLDQSIAEREQARADTEQERLDREQLALDADILASDELDPASRDSQDQRQVALGEAQGRSDAVQTQLDDNQRAQNLRRDVLDEQQAPLDQPLRTHRSQIQEAHADAAAARGRALRLRAEAALARAEQAHQRAKEALRRVEASEDRKQQIPR